MSYEEVEEQRKLVSLVAVARAALMNVYRGTSRRSRQEEQQQQEQEHSSNIDEPRERRWRARGSGGKEERGRSGLGPVAGRRVGS